MTTQFYRHGDVGFYKIDALPKGLEPANVEQRIIIAEGEATGHAHAIYEPEKATLHVGRVDAAALLRKAGFKLADYLNDTVVGVLEVNERCFVEHEEHASSPLDPGYYLVGIQNEWDEQEGYRRVAD